MSPDAQIPAATLICSTGALAGLRFELGVETTIGFDTANEVAVIAGVALARPVARIHVEGGVHQLTPLGARGDVTLDGAELTATVPLEKRHVIGVRKLAEFIYSKSRAPAAPPPSAPAPSGSPPPDKGTMMAKGGFDALPELVKGPPRAAPPVAPDKGTMIAKGGFDALPELVKGVAPTPSPAPPAAPVPAPPPPQSPQSPQSRGRYVPPPGVVAPPMPAAPPPVPATPPPAVSDDDSVEGATVATPARVVMPGLELVISLPDHGRLTFPLRFGDNIVGRGKDADVQVPDPKKWLSRRHVNVRVSAERIELIDLGGTNGTFVNGKRVTNAVILPGSHFDLGPSMAFTLKKT